MFGFLRKSEFDAFKADFGRELARLRTEVDQLKASAVVPAAQIIESKRVSEPPKETSPLGTCFDLLGADRTFPVPIVGESYRQPTLKALAGDRRLKGEEVFFTAALVPEPYNPRDPNAVRVNIHGGGHVGYLAREVAADYREVTTTLVASNAIGLCQAKLIGGTAGKSTLGVQLDLSEPHLVLADLTGKCAGAQPF